MGLKAIWTIVCDECGLSLSTERRPEDGEWIEGGVTTTYIDEWGPGIPDGWIQIPEDTITGRAYIFFHEDECYKNWLRRQGRVEELEEFESRY